MNSLVVEVPYVLIAANCPECNTKYGITEDAKVGLIVNITDKTYEIVTEGGDVLCRKCGTMLETAGNFYVQASGGVWLLIKSKAILI